MLDCFSLIRGLESCVRLSCRWVHLVDFVSKLFGLDPDATAVAAVVAEAVVLTSVFVCIVSVFRGAQQRISFIVIS